MSADTVEPYYHVGIVVEDLDSARRALTEQVGVRWGPVLRLDAVQYRDADGNDLELPTTMCYSVDAPHLELIQEVPGSVWSRNEHSNLHHLGYWADDLFGGSDRLSRIGCPLQLCGRNGDQAPVSFSYHRNDLGVRIELVDAAMRGALEFLFTADDT